MITLRLDSNLHGIILRDSENHEVSTNTLLLRLLNHVYEEHIQMTKTDAWEKAKTFIKKNVKGKDELTGNEVEGECYGVDCHVRPMGKRGIFLVVRGPNKTTCKIDFLKMTPNE